MDEPILSKPLPKIESQQEIDLEAELALAEEVQATPAFKEIEEVEQEPYSGARLLIKESASLQQLEMLHPEVAEFDVQPIEEEVEVEEMPEEEPVKKKAIKLLEDSVEEVFDEEDNLDDLL